MPSQPIDVDRLERQQRAFLLNHLAATPHGLTQKTICDSVPRSLKTKLKLGVKTVGPLLKELTSEGLIGPGPEGVFPTYVITDAGRKRLVELAEYVPQPTPEKEKKPRAPKKPLAEQTAENVRAKVAALGDLPVTASKLAKPAGKKASPEATAAFERTVRELLAEGKLFEHPGDRYGKHRPLTLEEIVRSDVQANLASLSDPFPPAALSKPKKGTSAADRSAHAAELARHIHVLVAEGKLFSHPGGKYGKTPCVEPPLPDADIREAYILDIFSRAAGCTIPMADIERAFDGELKKKEFERDYPDVKRFRGQGSFLLNPAATRHAIRELVEKDFLEAAGAEAAVNYTLSAAGAERLKDLREEFPVLPPTGKPATADDEKMRGQWEAFVLLNLLNAPDHMTIVDDVYEVSYPNGSRLNDATTWKLRGELVKAGYIALEGSGAEAKYTLTPAGTKRLAGLSFDAFPEVKLKGTALTELLVARGGLNEQAPAPPPPPPPPTAAHGTPSAAELESAVTDIFHRLLRERHANIRMVPIHEVRAEVKQRFGERAASREVFDELLLDMRRAKKVRLVSIDDRSRATEQQLQDSVFAVGETFFYLEAAHAPVSSG